MTIMMNTSPKCTFRYKDVNICGGDFSLHDITILLTTKITCVQYFDSINFDNKHGSSNNMAGNVWGDFYAFFFDFHTKFYLTDAG